LIIIVSVDTGLSRSHVLDTTDTQSLFISASSKSYTSGTSLAVNEDHATRPNKLTWYVRDVVYLF